MRKSLFVLFVIFSTTYAIAQLPPTNMYENLKIYESNNEMIESIISSIDILNSKTNALANDIDNINNKIKKRNIRGSFRKNF